MKEYKLVEEGRGVIRTSDNAFIPETEGNRDWNQYQKWLNDGNTPSPARNLNELRSDRKLELEAKAEELINTQVGDTPGKQLLLVATGLALLDSQVGQGNPRDFEQDRLVSIFAYIQVVNSNLEDALIEIETSKNPSTVNLVHPVLP